MCEVKKFFFSSGLTLSIHLACMYVCMYVATQLLKTEARKTPYLGSQ